GTRNKKLPAQALSTRLVQGVTLRKIGRRGAPAKIQLGTPCKRTCAMRIRHLLAWIAVLHLLVGSAALAQDNASAGAQTSRLYEGITAYVPNPEGKAFSIHLEIRDINLFAQGPREVLFKVYDP